MRDPSTHWLTLQMPPAARIQPGLGQARAGAGTQPRSALRRARTQLWKAPDSQGASARSSSRADGAGPPAFSCGPWRPGGCVLATVSCPPHHFIPETLTLQLLKQLHCLRRNKLDLSCNTSVNQAMVLS